MYTSFIFDMDGVLIESEEFYFKRRLDYVLASGATPTSSRLIDYIGLTDDQIWERLVSNPNQRKFVRASYHTYYQKHPTDFRQLIRPEVAPLFHALKESSKKIGIASSSRKGVIEKMLNDCNLTQFVDYYISGEEVPISKPNPDIYLQAHNYLGKELSTVAIEDSPVGIQAAKAAGLHTVALKQSFELDQRQADSQIDNLQDLLQLV